MQKSIIIKRFTAGSLFKIVAIGCSISLIGFAVLMGFFALLGAHTVHWNRESLTGIAGLIASPFIGLFLAALFTVFGWLGFALSFWLFSLFGRLRVDYIADESSSQTETTSPNNRLGFLSRPQTLEYSQNVRAATRDLLG